MIKGEIELKGKLAPDQFQALPDEPHKETPSRDKNIVLKKLVQVILLAGFFMTLEIIGGILADSIAIMSDAAHMLSDLLGFAISMISVWISTFPANNRNSYGYQRAGVIGALSSVGLIWVLTGFLVYYAIERIIYLDEVEIHGGIMLITACFGLATNLVMVKVLHGSGHAHGHGNCSGHGHSHSHGSKPHKHDYNPPNQKEDHYQSYKDEEAPGVDSRGVHDHNSLVVLKSEVETIVNDDHHHGHHHDHHHGHDHDHDDHHNHQDDHHHNHNHDHHHDHKHEVKDSSETEDFMQAPNLPTIKKKYEINVQIPGEETTNRKLIGSPTEDSTPLQNTKTALSTSPTLKAHAKEHTHVHNHDHEHDHDHDHSHGHKHSHDHDHHHDHDHDHDHSHSHSHEHHSHSHDHHHDHSDDHHSHSHEEDLNIRAAAIHILGDILQSIGVIIASAAIYFSSYDLRILDPLLTLLFSIIVLFTTKRVVQDCLNVIMQSTPANLDLEDLTGLIKNVPDVISVHNLHIWSLNVGKPILSAHIFANGDSQEVLKNVTEVCRKMKINHTTIQVESTNDKNHHAYINCNHKVF